MKSWKKKANATFGIDEKELVLVVLLQILGEDGSLLWLLFGSLFGVSSVHFCLICSVSYTNYSFFLRGWAIGMVFMCQLIHCDALLLSPAHIELRITKNWISLETIVNSIKILFDTSRPRVVGHKMLFLYVGFSLPRTTRYSLLDDVVLDSESIQSP